MTQDVNSGNIGKMGGVNGNLAHLLANRWMQWAFILSCVAMSAGFTKPSVVSLVGNILACAIAYYIVFRKRILEHIFVPFSLITCCVALVFTLFAVGFCVPALLNHFPDFPYRVQTRIGIPSSLQPVLTYIGAYLLYCTTAPVFFAFFYGFISRFVPFITDIYRTSDKIERYFFVAVMLIAAVAVPVIYNQTNCFYAPLKQDGSIIVYDVVYTSDSGDYYKTNVYGFIGAPENDVRQPLFGFFALPFAVIATHLSWIFFFIPNSYAVFIQTIQIGLLFITYIMVSRLMRLSGLTKGFFFVALVLTYPILLFSLMWEQYIFAVFWLVVFIYVIEINKQNHPLAFVASTGSLLTNAAVFVFTFTKDRRQLIHNGLNCACYFLIFLVLSGKLVKCAGALHLLGFTGIKLPFHEKFLQYVNFVSSCCIVPEVVILGETNRFYRQAPVESLNLLGVALLAFCLLGFILNYKDRFAQICAFWIAFSFFVLCLVGWGTAENGLTLYTLYFGWAYFCLAFLAIEKLLQKLPAVKYTVYVGLIGVLAYINIPGIYDLIQFGIEYYPIP